MADEEKILSEEELKDVSGGGYVGPYAMIVGDCGGGYLSLWPQPIINPHHELARLSPGGSGIHRRPDGAGDRIVRYALQLHLRNVERHLGLGRLRIPHMIIYGFRHFGI